ncbi:MAG: hypothetical protein LBH36_01465 [Candidatus Nomurabacteria bacterium]|jgi:hypothetical protein|nr:hypothetical protein [Candidatus Nomurabacteria bacterium]
MAVYHQKVINEDAFLRDQARGELKTVLWVSLLTGLLAVGSLFLLLNWLDTARAFNISLVVAATVGTVIYAKARIFSGMTIFVMNLLVFWSFITSDSPSFWYSLFFVAAYVTVSVLTSQIWRIRKVWLAIVLSIPLVILPHLV